MKIENDEYIVEYDDSEEVKSRVFDRLMEYFKEQESFCSEQIQQCDSSSIEAPIVLSDIADDIIKFEVEWK